MFTYKEVDRKECFTYEEIERKECLTCEEVERKECVYIRRGRKEGMFLHMKR